MHRTRKFCTFGLLAVCAVLIGFNAMGSPLVDPLAIAGLGMLPFAVSGEMDMKGLQDMLKKQDEMIGELRRLVDEKMALKADGKSVSDQEAKIAAINADLTKLGEAFTEYQRKTQFKGLSAGGPELTDAQVAYKQAFQQFLRKGDENGLADLQVKAYNSSSGPDGGYLIMPEMDTEIIRVVGVVSAIGRLSRQVTIGTDTWKKVAKKSGMAARRVGAGATGGETSTPTYAELEFPVHTAECEPWVFNETLQDAIVNLEADLTLEAGIAFAELAGTEFATGTGVGGARGITQYDTVANASYAWGKLGYVVTGNSGAFAASNPGDDIIDLQHALKQQYRPGAAFVMADATLSTVRQMKDGSGAFYLWQPDPLAGFGGRLLGSPVEIDDNMPVAAADSLSVAYGNFSQGYAVVNRMGTMVIRDNITAKGKTKFNFRRRFTGGVINFEAIKLLKFGTS